MIVNRIELINFRNIESLSLEFSNHSNIFIGQNGQGKTNLLESIYLLGHGKSFRSSDLSNLVLSGHNSAVAKAFVTDEIGSVELQANINREARNSWVINSKPVRGVGAFIGNLPCVSFAPDDLEIVSGGPAIRRDLLDRYISQCWPKALQAIVDYAKALKNKNSLLKQEHCDSDSIIHWNALLAHNGVEIIKARRSLVNQLQEEASLFHKLFADTDGELAFKLKETVQFESTQLSTQEMLHKINAYLPREIAAGLTLVGPHRDDMIILLGGRQALEHASQGQTRSIVLAIKLGLLPIIKNITQREPVVILDDVDAELDVGRSRRFFTALSKSPRQIFVSATAISAALMALPVPTNLYTVENGKITLSETS